MKKYFLSLISGMTICFSFSSLAQPVTVVFQPGAAIGKDVHIWNLDGGCIPTGFTTTPADLNFADSVELPAIDWTWNAGGCPGGTMRSLIQFTELSTIPVGSTILSATLDLFGVPSSTFVPHGNSNYPGSPYSNTNPAQLHVVNSPWNESTVTWNTAPSIAAGPALLTIPPSTTQWNYNYSNSSAALVTQVQNWVNAPATNHGFMMRLSTEVHYRSILFASSDHPNPQLRPRLTVKYTAPCNANFSFCSSTSNPYQYTFTAADASGTNTWNISPAGSASPSSGTGTTFTTTFAGPGSFSVLLTHTTTAGIKCERKFNLCINQNAAGMMTEIKPVAVTEAAERKITVSPNPVNAFCDVHYQALQPGAIEISIFDLFGKQVYQQKATVQEGENLLKILTQNLAAGTYIIQLIDNGHIFNERIVKQ